MRKFFGVFELFSCFAEAFVCTCLTPSTDRMLRMHSPPGGGGTPYSGLYGEAPPERGTFFRLQVYKRVGISQDNLVLSTELIM